MEPVKEEQTNFLAMPPEIRNRIYALSLIARSPIIVWSAQFPQGSRSLKPYPRLEWDREAMRSSVQNLSLNLLRCNSAVASEAASVFYGLNMFSFRGDHEYLPIMTWLDTIGEKNRQYLTSLEMTVRRPSRAWQRRNGTRQRIGSLNSHHQFFPRNSHFVAPSEPSPEGEVDNIDPAIETIFSIFNRWGDGGPKLTFHLKLDFDRIPGVILIPGRDKTEEEHFSMDLPNLIEKWRVDYTSDAWCRPIEVLWKAESHRRPFTEQRQLIEEQGWEIVEEEEAERFQLVQVHPRKKFAPYPTMRFSLRRKELSGPLVAADPNPYSWRTTPESS